MKTADIRDNADQIRSDADEAQTHADAIIDAMSGMLEPDTDDECFQEDARSEAESALEELLRATRDIQEGITGSTDYKDGIKAGSLHVIIAIQQALDLMAIHEDLVSGDQKVGVIRAIMTTLGAGQKIDVPAMVQSATGF